MVLDLKGALAGASLIGNAFSPAIGYAAQLLNVGGDLYTGTRHAMAGQYKDAAIDYAQAGIGLIPSSRMIGPGKSGVNTINLRKPRVVNNKYANYLNMALDVSDLSNTPNNYDILNNKYKLKAGGWASGGTVIPEDPIEGMMGPETTITASRPKKSIGNFFRRWGYEHSENPTFGKSTLAGALGSGIMSLAQLPQAAVTYMLDPKGNVLPSKALQGTQTQKDIEMSAAQGNIGAKIFKHPIVQDMVLDPLLLSNEIAKGVSKGSELINGLKKSELVNKLGNKYLPNAYKLNPKAITHESFNNPNSFYRQIDTPTFNEGLESGLIKGKQSVNKTQGENIINLNKSFGDDAYYFKGKLYSPQRADYIYEVNKGEEFFRPRVNNKDYLKKGVPYTVENTNVRVSRTPIPIEEATLYKKDWLKGYKPIEIPKKGFSSEIDWGKWNKEIPENTQLMQEYNTIEQKAKANNTWMKNPDGSKFQGTPEQFVQQNSQNFKKAFPHYHGEILNHNTNAELNTIDEYFFNKGAGDTGYYGKGTYTHPKKDYTKMYGKNNYEFYLNSKNKGFLDKSNIDDAEYFKRSDDEILQHHLPEYENKLMNYELDPSRYYDNAKENWLNKLNEQVKAGKISRDKLDEFTSLHNPKNGEVVIPFNNRVKSAIGNNGMFDMSNPNIYKGLSPTIIAGALANKKTKK